MKRSRFWFQLLSYFAALLCVPLVGMGALLERPVVAPCVQEQACQCCCAEQGGEQGGEGCCADSDLSEPMTEVILLCGEAFAKPRLVALAGLVCELARWMECFWSKSDELVLVRRDWEMGRGSQGRALRVIYCRFLI